MKAARSVRRGPDGKGVVRPPRRLATRLTGKKPAVMMPLFRETMRLCIPFLGREGIRRVHLWGVCYAPALGELLWLCDEHNITLSTDSSGPCVLPAYGQWGYAEWRDKTYRQPPVEIRGLERARHVQATRQWFDNFRNTTHYKPLIPTQMRLWFSGQQEPAWNR